MTVWNCPACGRQFAHRNQGHECAPAMTLAEYFATGPAREKPIFEAVMAHLATLGPVHVEPVSVGIFLKRGARIAELRTMQKWVALGLKLSHPVRHRLVTRKQIAYGGRYWVVANLQGPEDVDDEVRSWLTEAYLSAGK